MKPVILSEAAEETIYNHSKETYPEECCGFLFGADNGERRIDIALRAPNSKEGDKRRRFEIDPFDYMKAEQFALKNDTILLGIYHSHPEHPAYPSEHDRKQAVPFFSYIITSVKNGEIADITSWQLNENEQFDQEPLYKSKTVVNGKSHEYFVPIRIENS